MVWLPQSSYLGHAQIRPALKKHAQALAQADRQSAPLSSQPSQPLLPSQPPAGNSPDRQAQVDKPRSNPPYNQTPSPNNQGSQPAAGKASIPSPKTKPKRIILPGTTVSLGRRSSAAVPANFLGFSWETWMLPQMIGSGKQYWGPAGRLIRNLSSGNSFSLRLGGDSQDRSWWVSNPKTVPASLLKNHPVSRSDIVQAIPQARGTRFLITPSWINRLAVFSHNNNIHNLVGLNLASEAPRNSLSYTSQMIRKLGWKYIQGFEIGNEPNLYGLWRRQWQKVDNTFIDTQQPNPMEWDYYIRSWKAHQKTLHRLVPARKTIGPTIPCPFSSWCKRTGQFYRSTKGRVGMSTLHLYAMPLSTARSREQLLSDPFSIHLGGQIQKKAQEAHRAGLPIRLDEFNSSAHGGMPGTSDSFASALWAPGAMLSLQRAGVDGVNVHFGYGTAYKPFWIRWRGRRATAQVAPLYYGLQLFAWATKGHSRTMVTRQTGSSPGMDTWILRSGSGKLKALLINRSDRNHQVNLSLGERGNARMLRMHAASPASKSGVVLGGQRFGGDGRLHGRPVRHLVRLKRFNKQTKVYQVGMPSYSAALVSFSR